MVGKRGNRSEKRDDAMLAMLELSGLLSRAEAEFRARRFGPAADLARQVLARDPRHAGAHHLLGRIAIDTGDGAIATGLLSRALHLRPKFPALLVDYGRALNMSARHADAVSAFRKALSFEPKNIAALIGLGDALVELGRKSEALAAYRSVLTIRPDHPLASHMASALDAATDAAPSERYVASLFDGYAGTFEKHLVETLEYRVPALLRETVSPLAAGGTFGSALDIGCGTGLVAEALAGMADRIDGIDLSPSMVDAARAKNIYRHLAAGDAARLIAADPAFSGPYELVLAGDVFVYVGALDHVFAAVASALAPGGLFVFTVEHVETGGAVLRSSGRFAHDRAYVADLAGRHGFAIRRDERIDLRKERHQPIGGRIVVLEAPGGIRA